MLALSALRKQELTLTLASEIGYFVEDADPRRKTPHDLAPHVPPRFS